MPIRSPRCRGESVLSLTLNLIHSHTLTLTPSPFPSSPQPPATLPKTKTPLLLGWSLIAGQEIPDDHVARVGATARGGCQAMEPGRHQPAGHRAAEHEHFLTRCGV